MTSGVKLRRTSITPTRPTHGTSPGVSLSKLSNIPCPASHDVLATCVGTFGNVAAETHMRMSRTLRPDSSPSLRTLGAPARGPTSSFAAAVISLGDLERISARSALPRDQGPKRFACGRSDDVGAVRNLLSEPRHAPGLCFYPMYIGTGGEKRESHWARQRQRLSYFMPHAG